MLIDPVLPDFEFVRIRRSGGLLGVDESLTIDRDLEAKVSDRMRGDRSFALDAHASQELMEALKTLVERNPGASTSHGADLFHYDIELTSGGTSYHFSSVDLGADEALHGVMLAANRLIESGGSDAAHIMRLTVES